MKVSKAAWINYVDRTVLYKVINGDGTVRIVAKELYIDGSHKILGDLEFGSEKDCRQYLNDARDGSFNEEELVKKITYKCVRAGWKKKLA